MNKTEPRTLSGFMELLPEDQILFNQIKNTIEEIYKLYGFLPLNTPIIELSEVLLAKAGGETEKQIYRFQKGDTDLSLRFDLTVPLAKYVAKNYGNLSFPFRRYQIGKVYRGERTQKGRYREFYQCDIDIIGDEKLDLLNDAELPSIIYSIISKLDFGEFTICINNRKILTGLFEELELEQKSQEVLIIIDKIAKIGKDTAIKELEKIQIGKEKINKIIEFVEIQGTTDEKLQKLYEMIDIESQSYFKVDNEVFKTGVEELKQVIENIRILGIPDKNFKIDLSIVRGLDYYTGTVYETFLNEHKELGSICSGGRYENLAENYTDKKLPGVGISIGFTRLFYQLKESNLLKIKEKSISKIIIIPMVKDNTKAIKLASDLRNLGVPTQIFLEDKKLKAKLKYADKLNIPYMILIGEDEIKNNFVKVKNMQTGEEVQVELNAKTICENIKF